MQIETYITRLTELGFTQSVKRGVYVKTIHKRGVPIRLTVLTSKQDTTMLIEQEGQIVPFKFKFGRNYAGASEFIVDYITPRSNSNEYEKIQSR